MKSNVESELNPREQYNVHTQPRAFLKTDYDKRPIKVQLIGIVNITSDSFYDGGRYDTPEKAIAHGKRLIEEGADWLDIGAESTRPFSQFVSDAEQLCRVLPVIEALAPLIPLSIDTRSAHVAKQALAAGAKMINDTAGLADPKMCEIVSDSDALYCIMHSQGNPAVMQLHPTYPRGVITEIKDFFTDRIQVLTRAGVSRNRLILDPGIGYGKTVEHCFEILAHLKDFLCFDLPLYVGLSRKSFLQKTLGKTAEELLPATLLCDTVCLLSGASYLRVHDIKEHREMVKLLSCVAK